MSIENYLEIIKTGSNVVLNSKDDLKFSEIDLVFANEKFDYSLRPALKSTTKNNEIGSNSYDNSLAVVYTQSNQYGGTVFSDIGTLHHKSLDGTEGYSSQTTVGYRQSILRKFGKDYNTLDLYSAKAKSKLQKQKYNDVVISTLIEAIIKYSMVKLNAKQMEIYKATLESIKYNYELSKAKQKIGLVSKMDVYRAKIALLEAKNNLIKSNKYFIDNKEEALLFANIDKLPNQIEFSSYIKKFDIELKDLDSNNILNKNIAWNEILIQEKILMKKINNARRDFYPDANVEVSYSKYQDGYSKNFEDAWNLKESMWSFTINLAVETNTNSKEYAYSRLKIQQQQLQRDKKQLHRNIFKQIRQENYNYNVIQNDLETQKLKVLSAIDSLEVAKMRFQKGLASNLDVIIAQNSIEESQLREASLEVSSNITALKLLYLRGELSEALIYKLLNFMK